MLNKTNNHSSGIQICRSRFKTDHIVGTLYLMIQQQQQQHETRSFRPNRTSIQPPQQHQQQQETRSFRPNRKSVQPPQKQQHEMRSFRPNRTSVKPPPFIHKALNPLCLCLFTVSVSVIVGCFNLNIPYLDSSQSNKTTRTKVVVKAMELGHTRITYNHTIKGVMSNRLNVECF